MTTKRNEHAMEPQLTRNCMPKETFLTNRVAKAWSALSSETVKATSLDKLKAALDIEVDGPVSHFYACNTHK